MRFHRSGPPSEQTIQTLRMFQMRRWHIPTEAGESPEQALDALIELRKQRRLLRRQSPYLDKPPAPPKRLDAVKRMPPLQYPLVSPRAPESGTLTQQPFRKLAELDKYERFGYPCNARRRLLDRTLVLTERVREKMQRMAKKQRAAMKKRVWSDGVLYPTEEKEAEGREVMASGEARRTRGVRTRLGAGAAERLCFHSGDEGLMRESTVKEKAAVDKRKLRMVGGEEEGKFVLVGGVELYNWQLYGQSPLWRDESAGNEEDDACGLTSKSREERAKESLRREGLEVYGGYRRMA